MTPSLSAVLVADRHGGRPLGLRPAGAGRTRLLPARLTEAEFRALRAQISPHFVYNSLTTIASFVRTDPERARELLLDFADFARYALAGARRVHHPGRRARLRRPLPAAGTRRFGDRLRFTVRVAPEVLPVPVPFLCLQPLVENAIKHGMAAAGGPARCGWRAGTPVPRPASASRTTASAWTRSRPGALLGGAPGRDGASGIGLANVDARLRQIYGEEYGLVVETAPARAPRYGSAYRRGHTGVAHL